MQREMSSWAQDEAGEVKFDLGEGNGLEGISGERQN